MYMNLTYFFLGFFRTDREACIKSTLPSSDTLVTYFTCDKPTGCESYRQEHIINAKTTEALPRGVRKDNRERK